MFIAKSIFSVKSGLFLASAAFCLSFAFVASPEEDATNVQELLKNHHNDNAPSHRLKRFELHVTNTGFCRYKRFLAAGKIEYFSFNVAKFVDMDYYGSDKEGTLYLRTKAEDVIVQTYHDKGGDIDSVSTYMSIPIRTIEPEMLADLRTRLIRMSSRQLAQK
ncbi:hypothetical protein [Pedobacter deserti]|uniref:hypothetical protein n=1 Tax=Pedobacter deserti TaxID=2817382 RepID=UPI00210AF73C|nr:hypothetical protein [Pedobacter sp. SYSU D00382]